MRRALLTCLLLALLCSCAPPLAAIPSTPVPTAPEAPAAQAFAAAGSSSELVFALPSDADQTLQLAAQSFCSELAALTGGALIGEVALTASPEADLLLGRAQLAILNTRGQMAFSKPLAATAAPFLYNGYQSFTMRANAGSTLEILERSLRAEHGLLPLGAYYQGARHLLTDFVPNSYQRFEYTLFAVDDVLELREAIVRLGGDTQIEPDADLRMQMYYESLVNGTQISLTDLEAWGKQNPEGFFLPTYLTLSYHDIVPAWLLTRADFWDNLTPAARAQLKELCAALTHQIDDHYTARNGQILEARDIPNLTVQTEISLVRNRVFNTLQPLEEGAADQERLARELVQIMRRTA